MTLIERLTEQARSNVIPDQVYNEHGIPRGLRNKDGTGVRVFPTKISDVRGYRKEDGVVIPIEGELIYRGIQIEELVDGFLKEGRYGFEETAYFLMFGKLPSQAELQEFSEELTNNRALPGDFVESVILSSPNKDIMNKLNSTTLELSRIDPDPNNTSLENVVRQCISLIAKFPAIIAYSYHAQRFKDYGGDLFVRQPNGSKCTAESFLSMLRGDKGYTPLEAQILDTMLILHADHSGGNNSTFVVRCVTSTGTDTYSAISAGLGSLKGPKHGGACLKVMSIMDEIKQGVDDWRDDEKVADYLKRIIRREGGDGSGLIYGLGHAVYKKSDPRAEYLIETARKLALMNGRLDEFGLYAKVAELTPGIVKEVKGQDIGPNVDFYSGFIYDNLGFPREIYIPIFAMARLPGWSAHRIEQLINDPTLIRPASVYVGPQNQNYTPLAQRG